jgi:serine/threonine protein kinase
MENNKINNNSKNEQLSNDHQLQKEYSLIDDTYKILTDKRLGGGSFGHVYKCLNIKTNKEYSIKIESNDNTNPQLLHEYKILKSLEGNEGIPTTYLFKNIGGESILIMDLLGPNLEDILQDTKTKTFTLKTCLMALKQIIERLKLIHKEGIIHRDLKPENLLVTKNIRNCLIYLIDYGLSKKYKDIKNDIHIPFKNDRQITGTIRYVSINTHKGIEQSRRDDIESSLYIITYFLNGKLNWDGIKCKTKEEKIQKIMEKKEEFKNNKEYKKLPQTLSQIFQYAYHLGFEEKPNYEYIFGVINKGLEQFEGESNYEKTLYDWQSIEFVVEPIFMIEEMKQKKYLEKMKEEAKKREEEKLKEKNEDKNNNKEIKDDKDVDKNNKIGNNKINNKMKKNEENKNNNDNKFKKTIDKKKSKNKK